MPAWLQINESLQKEKLSLTPGFASERAFKFSHVNDLNPLTFSAGVPSALPDRVRGSFTSDKTLKSLWALPVRGCSRICKGGGFVAVGEEQRRPRQMQLASNQANAPSLAIFKQITVPTLSEHKGIRQSS